MTILSPSSIVNPRTRQSYKHFDIRPDLLITANMTSLELDRNPSSSPIYGADLLYVYPILTANPENVWLSTSPAIMRPNASTIALVEERIWERIQAPWAASLGLFQVSLTGLSI